jgi:hypothetical protein
MKTTFINLETGFNHSCCFSADFSVQDATVAAVGPALEQTSGKN